MEIKWLGHASFLITTRSGTKILTDPYKAGSFGGAVGYGKIKEVVDVVTVSHRHDDHYGVSELSGSPEVLMEPGEYDVMGIPFKGIPAYHDAKGGSERGENVIFTFEADGVIMCHLGDLGHTISKETASRIGEVDILFVPVGGVYTIDSKGANDVVDVLNPRIVVPMHYKTEVLGFPIAGVEPFLKGKTNVKKAEGSAFEIEKEGIGSERQIVVLKHAL